MKFMRTNELPIMNVMYLPHYCDTLYAGLLVIQHTQPNNYTHNGKSLADSFNCCSFKHCHKIHMF